MGRTLSLLRASVRIPGLELIVFILLMLLKLYLFDESINVRNMRMGLDDVIVATGTLGLIVCWTLWLPRRVRLIVLVALHLVLTVILYADLLYFRYFQDLISIPVLLQAGQVGALGDSIGSLLEPRDLLLFADWPLSIALALRVLLRRQRAIRAATDGPRWRTVALRLSLSVVVCAISLTLVFVPIQIAKRTWAQGLFVASGGMCRFIMSPVSLASTAMTPMCMRRRRSAGSSCRSLSFSRQRNGLRSIARGRRRLRMTRCSARTVAPTSSWCRQRRFRAF